MRIILIGPPGSGKGTQAKNISENLNIPHISTGEIFRENIKNSTELGKLAKSFIDKGNLVPDEVTIDMVKERLIRNDCENGFLLDGFPRTLIQAETLDAFQEIDKIIDIEVPDSSCVERIIGRGKESGGERADDNKETAKERLKIYHEQTEPIIEHYKKQGKVSIIDGTKTIEEVWNQIKEIIN